MNLQHLRYAVEVGRCRSITKAAAQLFIGQPNLSRAIRELELEIGASLFRRTSAGMIPTVQGEELLAKANLILAQMEEIHALGKNEKESEKLSLKLTVPRASYIAHAFTRTVAAFSSSSKIAVNYAENNSMQAINNLLSGISSLAVIRYLLETEGSIIPMLKNAKIADRPVMDFTPRVLLSKEHPLAQCPTITREMLGDSVEILHGDPFLPSLSLSLSPVGSPSSIPTQTSPARSIFIYERGSQFELLRGIPDTYMWVSPMPQAHLEHHGLVQLRCLDATTRYRDLLIYRKEHHFSPAETTFIELLEESISEVLSLAGEDATE